MTSNLTIFNIAKRYFKKVIEILFKKHLKQNDISIEKDKAIRIYKEYFKSLYETYGLFEEEFIEETFSESFKIEEDLSLLSLNELFDVYYEQTKDKNFIFSLLKELESRTEKIQKLSKIIVDNIK